MTNWGAMMVSAGALVFASFSSSGNYQLKSYSIGPGATSNSSSSTYHLQGSVGEQTNSSTSSSTRAAQNGSIQTEQLNVPPAPTLSNGSNTYYNKLSFVVSTGSNPTDTTYALAVSTNNFTSTLGYIQADGTIGASPVYRTYALWGGSGGSFMIGLATSQSYEVRVAAKEGLFTNTEYGAYATASTVAPSITFSVSPNTLTLSNLLPGNVITSSNLSLGFTTNAASGGAVYVSGQNSGLKSNRVGTTINAVTGDLTSGAIPSGFGVQASNPNQVSGGILNTVSPFNGPGNTVGAESAVPQQMLSSNAALVSGTANATAQAKASSTTPASADYQEILTMIAAANF